MGHLDPFRSTPREIDAFRSRLERRNLGLTIESGARFLLDPHRKHHPTLLSSGGSQRRQELLIRLIDLAAELGSPLLSIWSGAREPDTPDLDFALDLLAERLKPVLERAALCDVLLCFEPEPGMLVETLHDYLALTERLGGQKLWLTLDTGHLAARETPPYERHLLRSGSVLRNLHLDDAPAGEHEHRFFGEGVLDFRALFGALRQIDYDGPLSVELSRHSHLAPQMARRAIDFLRTL